MNASSDAAELLTVLREGLAADDASETAQRRYETWLKHESWSTTETALPLVTGIDPADWDQYLDDTGRAAAAAQLAALMQGTLGETVEPPALALWARQHGVSLPVALARLLDFIGQVLPQTLLPAAPATEATSDSEAEQILGAALALVARFPDRYRNEHGFVDGQMLTDAMLEQAAVWFSDGPPSRSSSEIAAYLERWLD